MARIPRASHRMEGHCAICIYAKWGDRPEWADSLLMACCVGVADASLSPVVRGRERDDKGKGD